MMKNIIISTYENTAIFAYECETMILNELVYINTKIMLLPFHLSSSVHLGHLKHGSLYSTLLHRIPDGFDILV